MPIAAAGTKSYQDFSSNLHERMQAERVAASATIEISRRCPLKCVHCYNNLPMGDMDAKRGELTYSEHCRILDELAEAGCLWILYTGGEIFARKDFLDIYTYAKKKGFLITLFTNGNADHAANRRLPCRMASLFNRNHAVRAQPGDLRAPHRHSRFLRPLPARNPSVAGPRAAAEAEVGRNLREQTRGRRHEEVR